MDDAADDETALGAGRELLISTLSHDLRGPLATIASIAHTLEAHGDRLDEPTRTDLVRRIASKAEGLTQLVTELLDLTRFEDGTMSVRREPVPIDLLVHRIVAEIDDGDRARVQVPPITMLLDPMMTGRVVTNLVRNALIHAGPAASVWVRGGQCDGGLELIVEDDGPGIPEEAREHLFDAFHTTTDGSGTGFGLAVVSRFTRLQGGDVSVGDRHGGGASFRIWLPDAAHLSGGVVTIPEAELDALR